MTCPCNLPECSDAALPDSPQVVDLLTEIRDSLRPKVYRARNSARGSEQIVQGTSTPAAPFGEQIAELQSVLDALRDRVAGLEAMLHGLGPAVAEGVRRGATGGLR